MKIAQSNAQSLLGECLICGIANVRVVRDHDHRTGYVRGLLCQPCNNRLGVYEGNNFRLTARGRRLYRAWVSQYHGKIEQHLKRNTGFLYRP